MLRYKRFNMIQKLPSDLWFSDADSLPWFLVEMGLKSCYDLRYCGNNEKLIEKYGIKRRECVNANTGYGEYGHHFVLVDKEKYDKEMKRNLIDENQVTLLDVKNSYTVVWEDEEYLKIKLLKAEDIVVSLDKKIIPHLVDALIDLQNKRNEN